jgi:hypothetical protein
VLILRILAVLIAIGGVASLFAFAFTQDRRYLRFALRIAQFALIAALVFLGLLLLERVLLPVI